MKRAEQTSYREVPPREKFLRLAEIWAVLKHEQSLLCHVCNSLGKEVGAELVGDVLGLSQKEQFDPDRKVVIVELGGSGVGKTTILNEALRIARIILAQKNWSRRFHHTSYDVVLAEMFKELAQEADQMMPIVDLDLATKVEDVILDARVGLGYDTRYRRSYNTSSWSAALWQRFSEKLTAKALIGMGSSIQTSTIEVVGFRGEQGQLRGDRLVWQCGKTGLIEMYVGHDNIIAWVVLPHPEVQHLAGILRTIMLYLGEQEGDYVNLPSRLQNDFGKLIEKYESHLSRDLGLSLSSIRQYKTKQLFVGPNYQDTEQSGIELVEFFLRSGAWRDMQSISDGISNRAKKWALSTGASEKIAQVELPAFSKTLNAQTQERLRQEMAYVKDYCQTEMKIKWVRVIFNSLPPGDRIELNIPPLEKIF